MAHTHADDTTAIQAQVHCKAWSARRGGRCSPAPPHLGAREDEVVERDALLANDGAFVTDDRALRLAL